MKRLDLLKIIFSKSSLFIGALMFLQSCNVSGIADAITSGTCLLSGAGVSVGSNHGHTVSNVPWADIDTAVQKTYTVETGTAGHSHTYTIPASLMAQMKSGDSSVVVTSETDGTGHTHTITVRCSH